MSPDEAVEAWQLHCADVNHVTAAEAEDQGMPERLRNQFARYGLTRYKIYCSQRDCHWTLKLEDD